MLQVLYSTIIPAFDIGAPAWLALCESLADRYSNRTFDLLESEGPATSNSWNMRGRASNQMIGSWLDASRDCIGFTIRLQILESWLESHDVSQLRQLEFSWLSTLIVHTLSYHAKTTSLDWATVLHKHLDYHHGTGLFYWKVKKSSRTTCWV